MISSLMFPQLLFIFLIIDILIKSNQCFLSVDQTNVIGFSEVFNKFSSIQNQSQSIVNRFECPKGWQRFGGSCYYLSNMTSTFDTANQTCIEHYFNHSRLIQIRQPLEIYYAAHILVKEDLFQILIQIDSTFFEDRNLLEEFSSKNLTEWKLDENRFQRARLKYFNRKRNEDREINLQSKTNDENILQISIDDTRHVCDALSWNAFNNNTNEFLLTRYVIGNKIICSIIDLQPQRSYEHLCQYVLDFCFDNHQCGRYGRCVNQLMGFKCSCHFWKEGRFCREISTLAIQFFIGVFLICLFYILSIEQCQQCQKTIIKKLEQCIPKSPIPSTPIPNDVVNNSQHTSESHLERKEKKSIRMLFVIMSMSFIFLLLCVIPMISHWNSLSDLKQTQSMIDQCKSKYLLPKDNHLFLPVSILLWFSFSFFVQRRTCCVNTCDGRPGCLSPFEPFSIINRWETAALCGIILIEVLTTLEYFLVDLSEIWKEGVLVQLVQRTLIPLVYSIRYYPLFASLQHRDFFIRFFSFVYLLINIIYLIIRQSSCMDFLAISKRFSSQDEAKSILKMGNWTIIYGLIKNCPQFLLLSYVLAELFIRFIYDSCYMKYIQKTKKVETPSNHLPYSSTVKHNSFMKFSLKIKELVLKRIYPWDEHFRYTTLSTCTYTIAFLLVYYLTCIFTFQSMMGTSSISFCIFSMEYLFQIDLENDLFLREIILSGILTMFFFSWQFIQEMIHYRIHTKQLKDNKCEDIRRLNKEEEELIPRKSIEYLTSLIVNIIGSFFIWFHLILFFIILLSLLSFRAFTLQIHRLEFISSTISIIGPLLVLYLLKKSLTNWFGIFISKNRTDNQSDTSNEKSYGIIIYFTFISSCHIVVFSSIFRLIKGTLFNILLMPRSNCSYIGRIYEKYDNGYMAYVSHLYMEKKYRQPIEINPTNNNTESSPISIPLQSSEQFVSTAVPKDSDAVSLTPSSFPEQAENVIRTVADDDDRSISSEKCQTKAIITSASSVSNIPLSSTPQDSTANNEQHSTESKPTITRILQQNRQSQRELIARNNLNSDEQEQLLSSTPQVNEEQDSPPPSLPEKTSRKTTS